MTMEVTRTKITSSAYVSNYQTPKKHRVERDKINFSRDLKATPYSSAVDSRIMSPGSQSVEKVLQVLKKRTDRSMDNHQKNASSISSGKLVIDPSKIKFIKG